MFGGNLAVLPPSDQSLCSAVAVYLTHMRMDSQQEGSLIPRHAEIFPEVLAEQSPEQKS